MEERDKNYFHPITHEEYEGKKLGETGKGWVVKRIYNEGYKIEWNNQKKTFFLYIDDKYMVLDETNSIKLSFKALLVGVLIIPFIYLMDWRSLYTDNWFVVSFFFFSIAVSIILFYYSFFHPPYIYIYNRLDGTVTMPLLWGWGSCTMEFRKLKYGITTTRMGSSNLNLSLPKSWTFPRDVGGLDPQTDMSLHTWYMDKNRPLPPGSAYDPYRERDFQRRKAEGFPDPLYQSLILTPEQKPEQDEEVAKAQRINIETFTREDESEWYSRQKHGSWPMVKYITSDTDISPLKQGVLRYEFADGHIIYARSNQFGLIPQPPESEKYTIKLMKGASFDEVWKS